MINHLSEPAIYELITETTNEGIWIIDSQNKTSYVNRRMAELLEYSINEMMERTLFDFMDKEGIEIAKKNLERRKSGISELHEFKLISKTNKEVWTYMNTNPIIVEGQYIGALAMVSDITNKKRKEKEQEEDRLNYISLFEDSPIPIWEEDFTEIKEYLDRLESKGVKDLESYFKQNMDAYIECMSFLKINKINQAVVELYEADSKDQVLSEYAKLLNFDAIERGLAQLIAIAEGATFNDFDSQIKTFKGNMRDVHFQWSVVKGYGKKYQHVHVTATDITERIKEENLVLQRSIREKEVLLKEVHHRVKNNLQIIISLLKLQSQSLDKGVKAIFDLSINRIYSMAKVHDLLYNTQNFEQINFKEYLNHLVDQLLKTVIANHENISVDTQVEDCIINVNTAIPLGMLINEILTNSLKHGIPHGSKGKLFIDIHRLSDNKFILKIGDNGIGITKVTNEGLGTHLIESFVDQLSGTLKLTSTNRGTCYEIQFSELE